MNADTTVSLLIGRKIKSLRCSAGYTASEFAKLTGCKSEQQLYRYERAVNKIDIDGLISMLKSLDVNVSHFFDQIVEEAAEKSEEPEDYNVTV